MSVKPEESTVIAQPQSEVKDLTGTKEWNSGVMGCMSEFSVCMSFYSLRKLSHLLLLDRIILHADNEMMRFSH